MAKTRKFACRECPFRRTSTPGYLGEATGDPRGFLAPHYHGGSHLPCHMKVDWTSPDRQLLALEAPACVGLIQLLKNSCKYPESRHQQQLVAQAEVDRKNYFGFPHEFIEHHTWPPIKPKETT